MRKVLKVDSPNVFASHVNAPILHPHISVIHFDELPPCRNSLNSYSVWGLFIQREFPKNLSYGTTRLLAEDASIIAVAPGQIGGGEDTGELLSLSGWVVLWDEQFLGGTPLEGGMDRYQYFSYFATEALRMEGDEPERIGEIASHMRDELVSDPSGETTRDVVAAHLQLLLEYCNRIYLRQLSSLDNEGDDLLKRFNKLLRDYFASGRAQEEGLPSVGYFASCMAYSPRYFGDLVHKATGGSAISYIHEFVVAEGKSLLLRRNNVSETARLLGFEYPHHFSRLFKKVTGLSPREFLGK